MKRPDTTDSIRNIYEILRRFISLHVENARLTATEKVTLLFTAITYYSLLTIAGTVALVFISIGVGHLLATTVALHFAYLYVAAFYLAIFIAIIVFKRQLILNPICRFISRLLAKNPNQP